MKPKVLIKTHEFNEALARVNLKKEDASRILGISQQYLSDLISQKYSPGPELRQKMLIMFSNLGLALTFDDIFFILNSRLNENNADKTRTVDNS